jgi:hypothetical protein
LTLVIDIRWVFLPCLQLELDERPDARIKSGELQLLEVSTKVDAHSLTLQADGD